MSLDLRDELRNRYGAPATPTSTPVDTAVEVERAFVLHAESGRTVITAPVREVATNPAAFLYLNGRFVEADTPNTNGALWTTADLELGQGTVAGGPLNWLHDETKIIGSLLSAQMVYRPEAAGAGSLGNHIASSAAVWRFLFPYEAETIQRAAADHQLYYSMECVSREVACVDTPDRPGCGEAFSYSDYDAGRCCTHLRERSSIRRFVDPIFLGGAVIVPPVRPGWPNAQADVVRQAAEVAERHQLDGGDLTHAQAEDLATAVLQWANRS